MRYSNLKSNTSDAGCIGMAKSPSIIDGVKPDPLAAVNSILAKCQQPLLITKTGAPVPSLSGSNINVLLIYFSVAAFVSIDVILLPNPLSLNPALNEEPLI